MRHGARKAVDSTCHACCRDAAAERSLRLFKEPRFVFVVIVVLLLFRRHMMLFIYLMPRRQPARRREEFY